MNNKLLSLSQPKGFIPLLLIQIFYSIGFFVLFANLTLYSANELHIPDRLAYHISTTFLALVYALAVFGGYLSNRFLGYIYGFAMAVTLCALGFALLLFKNSFACFNYGLAMIALAEGIALPAIYVLLGSLYKPHDAKRTSGFILLYIGMNIGSFIGAVISGPLAEGIGYHAVFIISLLFTILSLAIFLSSSSLIKNRLQLNPSCIHLFSKISGTFITILMIPFAAFIMTHPNWSTTILIGIGLLAFVIVFFLSRNKNPDIQRRMKLFLFLCLLYIVFWAVYFIIPTILPLFIHRNVARVIMGVSIPAVSFYAINPIVIIFLGPLTGGFWLYLAKKGYFRSIPSKFALGLSLVGTGYLILSVGIHYHNSLGFTAWGWVVLSSLMLTLGELCIGPIGYAMVGEVVPRENEGLMMGIWQLMAGVASVLTSFVSRSIDHTDGQLISPLLTNPSYLRLFSMCGIVVILIAVLTVFYLQKNKGKSHG